MIRRVLLLTIAVFVLGIAATPAMAASTPEACGHACAGTSAVTQGSERSTQCLPDAGCGGGAFLSAGSAPLISLAAATGVVVLAVAALRRRYSLRNVLPTTRLLATRLFHPPQFSLSV
jgi:hypothetical protein